MQSGKLLILLGLGITIVGLIYYYFGDKLTWIGNLPGDIKIERENFKFYFPITTMILFSILINLLLKLINKIN
jgi:hypothetical protein